MCGLLRDFNLKHYLNKKLNIKTKGICKPKILYIANNLLGLALEGGFMELMCNHLNDTSNKYNY